MHRCPFLVYHSFCTCIKRIEGTFRSGPRFTNTVRLDTALELFIGVITITLLRGRYERDFVGALNRFVIRGRRRFSRTANRLATLLSTVGLNTGVVRHSVGGTKLISVLNTDNTRGIRNRIRRGLSLFTGRGLGTTLGTHSVITNVTSRRRSRVIIFRNYRRTGCIILVSPLSNSSGVSIGISINAVFSVCHHIAPINAPMARRSFLRPNGGRITTNCIMCNSSAVLICAAKYNIRTFACSPSLNIFYLYRRQVHFPRGNGACSVGRKGCVGFPGKIGGCVGFYRRRSGSAGHPCASHCVNSLITSFRHGLLGNNVCLCPDATDRPSNGLHLLCRYGPVTFLTRRTNNGTDSNGRHVLSVVPRALRRHHSFFINGSRVIRSIRHFVHRFPSTWSPTPLRAREHFCHYTVLALIANRL